MLTEMKGKFPALQQEKRRKVKIENNYNENEVSNGGNRNG